MSQQRFFDPIVSAGPTRVGVGNGVLAVDRLTHFTVAQSYTFTCIGKSPDTTFSVVGSVDGSVGIATVGTQFRDPDSKIFVTIQQGATAFEVGDIFTLTVENGTDLNQDNIDTYDHEPQKNFAPGIKGTMSGDANIRYDDANLAAVKVIQDLKFTSVAIGPTGDTVQVEYLPYIPGSAATLTYQDLTFTSVADEAAANSITIAYTNFTPAVVAQVTIQQIRYRAVFGGTSGNSYTIQYANDVLAGAEYAAIVGTAITVHFESGVSTASAIISAFNGTPSVFAVVEADLQGANIAQTAPVSSTPLAGGANAIGDAGNEVVSVVGNAISVKAQLGTSTATQIKAKLDASVAASALITTTVTGTGSNAQTGTFGPTNLVGGTNSTGGVTPAVIVSGNLIRIYFRSGRQTASQLKAAFDASAPALALATVAIVGNPNSPQNNPVAASNLVGGRNKYFTLNEQELTDVPNFFEGNASVLVRDLHAQGAVTVDGVSEFKGQVALESSSSGPNIADAQRALNDLITAGKLTVHSVGHSPAFYTGGVLTLPSNLQVSFRDSSTINTVTAGAFTLGDGDSLYVELDQSQTVTIATAIAAQVPNTPTAFRIATRVGSKIIWFNGEVQNDGEHVRVGGAASLKSQVYNVITGGGTLERSTGTPGLVSWSNPIIIKQVGSTAQVTIAAGSITLADGEAAYVEIDEPFSTGTKTLLKAALSTADLGRDDRYWIMHRDGTEVRLRPGHLAFASGSGGTGNVRADLYDPVSTALPTTAPTIIDGVTVASDQLVLFSNLSSNNNRIYKATVSGGTISWAVQSPFPAGINAAAGDTVTINQGTGFGLSSGIFNGTTFKFNDVVRYFSGTDYWEMSSLKTLTVSASTTANVFTVAPTGSENMVIDFSIIRGVTKETGTLHLTTDGTNVAVVAGGAYIGTSGVTFTGDISAGQLRLRYSADASLGSGTLKYFVRRWSDSAGGPGGIPSYSGGGSSVGAAGSTGQIQFNDSGNLAADADFTWDSSGNILGLGALEVSALITAVLPDNTASPTAIITTAKRFAIIDYSITRDSQIHCGTMYVGSNGSSTTFTSAFTESSPIGVTFAATVSGGNTVITYTTNSTGFSAQFKYSIRRWT